MKSYNHGLISEKLQPWPLEMYLDRNSCLCHHCSWVRCPGFCPVHIGVDLVPGPCQVPECVCWFPCLIAVALGLYPVSDFHWLWFVILTFPHLLSDLLREKSFKFIKFLTLMECMSHSKPDLDATWYKR